MNVYRFLLIETFKSISYLRVQC